MKDASASWKKFAAAATYIFILLILAVFPLYLDVTKYVRLTLAKYRFFMVVTGAYLGLLLLRYLSGLIGREVRLPRPQSVFKNTSVTQKAMALFLVAALLSSALSPYPGLVWKGDVRFNGMYLLLAYGLAFFAVSCFGTLDRWHVWAAAAGTFLFSLIGILQYFGLDVLRLYPAGDAFASLPFLTTAGNVDFVSALLSVLLPLLSAGYITGDTMRRNLLLPAILSGFLLALLTGVDAIKVALAGCLTVLLPVLFCNGSRMRNGLLLLAALCLTAAAANRIRQGSPAGLIAALAGAFVFLALTPIAARFVPGELPRRLRAAVVALPFAAVLAVAAASLLASKYNADNMLYELGEILQGRGLDYMGHGRIGIWHRALALAMERPLLGTGADTFATAFSQRFPTFVEETSGAALYDAAHNEYLQYLCLFGIPGCLAYLVWLGSLIARAFRPAASDGWTAMLLAGVVGYGIQAFFGISIVIAAPVFFVTAALLESRLNGKQRRRSTANTTPSPAGMVRI